MLTSCHQSSIWHPTLDYFIGLTRPGSLSSLMWPAFYRLIYLRLCLSQQYTIYYQNNIKLKLYWTIHHVKNQPNFSWLNPAKSYINLSLNPWRPFKGFHSRIMILWFQYIYGSTLPNILYTILHIRGTTVYPYGIVNLHCKNQWTLCPWYISAQRASICSLP